MKRKILTLFLCGLVMLSAGCGGKTVADSIADTDEQVTENTDDENNADDNEDAADGADNPDTGNAADTSDTENTDNDTSKEASSQLYSVVSEKHSEQTFSEDGKIALMSSDYDTLEIQGEGFDALKAAVTEWQQSSLDSLQNYISDYTGVAKEQIALEDEFSGYSLSQTFQVTRSDTHVLSLMEDYSEYTGGAHPLYYQKGINFNAATGEQLTLESIALDSEQFLQKALNYTLDYLKNSDFATDGELYPDYESMITESFSKVSWYFSAAGITLVYSPYDIAPYAAGFIEVTLPAAEFEPLLKEEYRLNAESGYVYVPLAETVTFSSDASGKTHTLMVVPETFTDDAGYESTIPYVTLDGTKTAVTEWESFIQSCYLIQQANGRILLALSTSAFSDDYETIFYDISEGTLEKFDSVYASIVVPGTETVTLNTYLYVLGTYSGFITYDISGSDGIRPSVQEYIIPSVSMDLTTIKELPVTNAAGEKILLPAGSKLRPVATDVESYVRVKDSATGEEYTIHFTKDESIHMIDGVDEYQYFENLPYAG